MLWRGWTRPHGRLAPAAATLILSLLLLTPGVATADAAPDDAARVTAALAHLAALHAAPGITGVPPSNVVELLGALSIDPKVWPDPENAIWDRLVPTGRSDDAGYKTDLRIGLAVSVAGRDARDVHGMDMVVLARAGFDGAQFGMPTTINDDAFAILALRAAGIDASDAAIQRAALTIEAGRAADGGWSHTPAASRGDPDMTGMMLAALVSAGRDVAGDARARTFLDRTLDASGGHTHPFLGVNCQSTVWAIHAYALLGDAPRPASLDYLRGLYDAPSGGFRKSMPAKTTDAWCTAEVALLLSGAHWPLPGHASGELSLPRATVGRPTSAHLIGAAERATWYLDGTTLKGTKVTWTPISRGAHMIRVHAEGPGGHAWLDGTWHVYAAPDIRITGLPERAFRHTAVALDASDSRLDGGPLSKFDVDWGDGDQTTSATATATHQYVRLGIYHITMNITDAQGVRSADVIHTVRVENRAPTFAPTPLRITADRVAPVRLAPDATDPDGDPVTLAWNTTAARGTGAFEATFDALGEQVVRFSATDSHGAVRSVDILVVVENLVPTIQNVTLPSHAVAGRAFEFAVDAGDADGPAPRVVWVFGARTVEGARGKLTLDAGRHDVFLSVEDRDGATRSFTTALTVGPPEAEEPDAPTGAPPIRNATASVDSGGVLLRFDADANATLRAGWTTDAGNGSARWTGGLLVMPSGWTRASGWLEATGPEGTTRVEWGPVVRPTRPTEPLRFLDAPPSATPAAPVTFRATHLGNGSTYRYHFGDGFTSMWTGAPVASHLFSSNGTFEVRVEALTRDHVLVEATHVIEVVTRPAPVPVETDGQDPAPRTSSEAEREGTIAPAPPATRRETPLPWGWLIVAGFVPLLGTRRRSV